MWPNDKFYGFQVILHWIPVELKCSFPSTLEKQSLADQRGAIVVMADPNFSTRPSFPLCHASHFLSPFTKDHHSVCRTWASFFATGIRPIFTWLRVSHSSKIKGRRLSEGVAQCAPMPPMTAHHALSYWRHTILEWQTLAVTRPSI